MQYLRELFWLSAHFNFRITAKHILEYKNTVDDAISHLHDVVHLFRACSFILPWHIWDPFYLQNCFLLWHMHYPSYIFLLYRYFGTISGKGVFSLFYIQHEFSLINTTFTWDWGIISLICCYVTAVLK